VPMRASGVGVGRDSSSLEELLIWERYDLTDVTAAGPLS
jgi:hypothetical protein